MLALVQFMLVPLGLSLVIGIATAWWIHRGGTHEDRQP